MEIILKTCDYKLINVDLITELPNKYPSEFIEFCSDNKLNPPKVTIGQEMNAINSLIILI